MAAASAAAPAAPAASAGDFVEFQWVLCGMVDSIVIKTIFCGFLVMNYVDFCGFQWISDMFRSWQMMYAVVM